MSEIVAHLLRAVEVALANQLAPRARHTRCRKYDEHGLPCRRHRTHAGACVVEQGDGLVYIIEDGNREQR